MRSKVQRPGHQSQKLPFPPIKITILNRFGDVLSSDIGLAGQIGNGAGDFQNTVVGPGRKPQGVDGGLEQSAGVRIDEAMAFDVAAAHLRIAMDQGAGKPLGLDLARPGDPFADGPRRFCGGRFEQVFVRHRRDLDMDVDAIHQRAGNFGTIALNLLRCAAACMFGIGMVAARAAMQYKKAN